MRFLMIDPFTKRIREHQTPKPLTRDFFRAEIGCDWVRRVKLTDQVEMWIDEQGLFDATSRQQFFTFNGYGAIHGGRAIVCGASKLGDSISVPASFNIHTLERHVQWLGGERRAQAAALETVQ
ncbi:hypothetical protein EN781_00250 [Mesorhizobium sp. M4A.F.Ca.ET.090.04.2.1]|uniref:DUF3846 domain-containing protein n=1 Tax=Mesorhizobium sp. M4A.F.Ca.ET.090.04.2.1 TaxID=2496663 RepID=UPI000FC9FA70|nr:hypothetical protein [Mesorhizobium sp. M4A.F.Ca.ET.090.04.2.1]RVC47602.1 hypothetical protein EN781_00250 [Mesorhizobium sp. M4A.F.Ca.ET.090.04.2.1]